MSKRNELAQVKRPYKVEVYGLQDNYIGTLQSYDDAFLGQIIEPEIVMSDDGTQTFSCRIPKFYINPRTNFKELNPRWGATEDGTLAENVRILKVFVQIENETRIYPFLINTITDNRDSNFAVYRSIEASGLAFAELGKIGYKIELNQTLVENEQKALDENEATQGQIVETTMDYWLKKVFPCETDDNGKIISWLTPWSYEVRMDWSYYAEERDSTKVYEDGYVSSWKYNNAAGDKADLEPASYESSKEKQRLLDVKNSNKYNISQTIAETFEVFCRYEYKCDDNGHFIREYTDAKGNVWTGRKVIFYNKAIKQENPLVVDYQKNLQTIKRSSDSTDVYTKLYVTPLEAEEMSDGYVTIANTAANPLYDEFLLNFDYMDKQGALTDFQKEVIKEYEVAIREANLNLEVILEQLEQARVARNDVESEQAFYDKSSNEAEEQYKYYSDLANNEITNAPVIKDSKNTYPIIFFEDGKDSGIYKANLDLHGIDITSGAPFEGYNKKDCEESKDIQDNSIPPIFNLGNCILSTTVPTTLDAIGESIVILQNDYGYPQALYCNGASTIGTNILKDEDGYIYLRLQYCPKNEYEAIRDAFKRVLDNNKIRKAALASEYNIYDSAYKQALEESNKLLAIKEEQNRRLERILGSALREGYWTPDDYSGSTETRFEKLEQSNFVSWAIDTEPLLDEWKSAFYVGANLDPEPYPYLDYRYDLDFNTYAPSDLVLYLNKNVVSDPILESNDIGWHSIEINYVKWYVNFSKQYIPGTQYRIVFRNGEPKFQVKEPNGEWQEINGANWTSIKPDGTIPPVKWVSDGEQPEISTIDSQQTLYYRSHFNYCYANNNSGTIVPIILIHTNNEGEAFALNEGVSYSVAYGFRETAVAPIDYGLLECRAEAEIVYPRLKINEKNVQAKSSLFLITKDNAASDEGIKLDRYYDYNIIIRDSYPLITLKIGDKILPTDILQNHFTFKYGVSRANEQLYLDAKDIAYDNSYPRYTYDLTIANLPDTFQTIDLGQLIYINDHTVGIHAATGYVSEVTLKLDQPQSDSVKVQNYKTKFEDLFNTIVAQSEAMKTNKHAYDIAASVFTQPGTIGQISGSILQTALNNNSFWLGWSTTGVEITNEQGIILTNKRPYANGVYGQVILQGGGIFLSNSIDANGNRIWSAAITPDGMNASLMTAGQLNTDRVLVYAGENMAFQWNGEGIFAYRRETDKPNEKEYVQFSQHGLHYWRPKMEQNGDNWKAIEGKDATQISVVALDWDGLTLTKNNGVKSFQIDRHTGDLTLSGTMKSSNYIEGASRILNTGWKINQDGYAEFNDLFVRGTISASVFEYEETSAIGGRMFVTPTIILKSDFTKTAKISQANNTDGNLQIKVDTGVQIDKEGNITIGGKTWKVDDVILFNGSFIQQQAFDVENEGVEYPIFEIKSLKMKITALSNGSMTLTSIAIVNEGITKEGVFYNRAGEGQTLEEVVSALKKPNNGISDLRGTGDWHLLSFSRGGTQEGILLTAIEPNSGAYIDILGKGIDNVSGSTRVRLGDLSALGADDNLVSALGVSPAGWGLFADNVYLRGAIYATSGKIGSLTIKELNQFAGQFSLVLTSETGFVYTEATDTKDLNCEVYYGNKRVTNKSDLPEPYQKEGLTFTFGYYGRERGGTDEDWIAFGAPWNSIPLFNDNGEINSLIYTTKNKPTREYIAALRLSEEVAGQQVIRSDIKTFQYAANGEKGDQGERGEQGKTGRNYYITSSANSVSVDVDGITPKTITLTALYSDEAGEPQPFTEGSWNVSLLTVDDNNNVNSEEVATTVNGNNCTFTVAIIQPSYVKRYEIILVVNGIQVQTISIPCVLSTRMRDLATIHPTDGVIVANDKVYAPALVAGSVISGKVSAGAIETGAIASDSTLYLLTGGDDKFEMPPEFDQKQWVPYSGASALSWNNAAEYTTCLTTGFQNIWDFKKYINGVRIGADGVRIRGNGIFEVAMDNFTVTDSGILTAKEANIQGAITATSGSIGGWDLANSVLVSSTQNNIFLKGDPAISEDDEENTNIVINIADSFIADASGNIQASQLTVDNAIVKNGNQVPSIIIADSEPTLSNADSFAPGSVLWLKPAGSSDSGSGGTAVESITYRYSTASGSSWYWKWTNQRRNLRANSKVGSTSGTAGRIRRGGYFTINNTLVDASTYKYSLTVPIYRGGAYNGMTAGAYLNVVMLDKDISSDGAYDTADSANAYNALTSKITFEPKLVYGYGETTVTFEYTSNTKLNLGSKLYFEIWTTAASGYYLSNIMNSSDGGNVTLKCEALN